VERQLQDLEKLNNLNEVGSMGHSNLFVESESLAWKTVGEGVQRKILGYDPELMMVHVTFKKGSIGPVHKHPHRQVTFVEGGSFEVQIGREKKILKTGDCFFVPPDVDHGVVALEDGGLVDVFTPSREDFLAVT
jgi:quercetin dioxygenase-like cupin family protein